MDILHLFREIEHLPQIKSIWDQFEFGIDKKQALEMFEMRGLKPIPELIELFAWHNGSVSTFKEIDGHSGFFYEQSACFSPLIAFFNLKDSLESYDREMESRGKYPLEEVNGENFIMQDYFFPIFNNNFFINLNPESETFKMIHTFDFSYELETIFPTIYDSLESVLRVYIKCIQEGVFFINSEEKNMLDMDFEKNYDRYNEIMKEFNPRSSGINAFGNGAK
jgi:hypothetical protein